MKSVDFDTPFIRILLLQDALSVQFPAVQISHRNNTADSYCVAAPLQAILSIEKILRWSMAYRKFAFYP